MASEENFSPLTEQSTSSALTFSHAPVHLASQHPHLLILLQARGSQAGAYITINWEGGAQEAVTTQITGPPISWHV